MADEKAKKNSVKMSVPNEPESVNPKGDEILKAAKDMPKNPAPPDQVAPGLLISTNDYPEIVKYGENGDIRISARARIPVGDVNQLPSQLPPGIHLRKD